MIVIDHFINLLLDGEWHTIASIVKEVSLCKKQEKAVILFLRQFDVVEIENGEVKLNEPFLSFMRATEATED